MQITIELDEQHIEKLHEQESKLKKNISELIALAVDETFTKKTVATEGEKLLDILKNTGYLASMPDDENLSENYKEHLDWSDKV